MANWYGLSRTNYFKVRDEQAFRAWADTVPEVEMIDDGKGRFGFYTNSDGNWPSGRLNETGSDVEEFDFVEELTDHLPEGEVAILITVGHEKARYGTGYAIAVRHDGEILDVNIGDIYALVHGTWGIEPTRAEY